MPITMTRGAAARDGAVLPRSSVRRRGACLGLVAGLLWSASLLPTLLAQPAAPPSPKPSVTAVAAPAPTPPAPAPPGATGGCRATTKGSFHLRPRPQAKSAGPKLPAGTSLEVLDLLALADSEKSRRGPIYKVRLPATGATGYAFLRAKELSAGCPFLWPAELELKAGTEVTENQSDCLRPRGKRLADLFKPACRDDKGKPEYTLERKLDVDGDGREDYIVTTESANTMTLALLLNTKAGWRTVVLVEDDGRDWEFAAATTAGAAAYLLHLTGEFEHYEDDDGETATDQTDTYHGFRVERTGKVFRVFEKSVGEMDSANAYRLAGNPDESVTLTSGKRSVRLRWDAPHKLLVPAPN